MAEVVSVLRDDVRVAEIVATAFADIAMNERWSYSTFAQLFDSQVGKLMRFDYDRPSRQADIDEIRKKYPAFLIDNPHEITPLKFKKMRQMLHKTGNLFRLLQ
jgi:hypothetical protein